MEIDTKFMEYAQECAEKLLQRAAEFGTDKRGRKICGICRGAPHQFPCPVPAAEKIIKRLAIRPMLPTRKT